MNRFSRLGAKLPAAAYWALPALLAILQLAYSLQSTTHIRAEELAESVRNVYWLERGTVYDSISSNVGYYGSLLVSYKLFGFWIFGAKLFRAALHLAALYALAFLLTRWLERKYAWLPLCVIALSPTMLYFNTMQTSYGIDLPYFLLCLLLIERNTFQGRWSYPVSFALGATSMLAAMSYPTFLFYLPVLGLLYLLAWHRAPEGGGVTRLIAHLLLGGVAFLLPLVGALAYVKDPSLLIYDPRYQAGIFRGGGVLTFEAWDFAANVLRVLLDLTHLGGSYYFVPPRVEFSNVLLWLFCLGVLIASAVLAVRRRELRLVLLLSTLLFFLHIVLPQLTAFRLPGIRRATGVLAAFYLCYCVVWFTATRVRADRPYLFRAAFVFCLLPLLHHLLVYPVNYAAIARPDQWSNRDWFAVSGNPHASLLEWDRRTAGGEPLACRDPAGRIWPVRCQYEAIYGAIQAHRLWNDRPNPPVQAFDWKTNRMITLDIQFYETHYFPH